MHCSADEWVEYYISVYWMWDSIVYQHNRCFQSLEHNSPFVGRGEGRGKAVVDDTDDTGGEVEYPIVIGSKEVIMVTVTHERKQQH